MLEFLLMLLGLAFPSDHNIATTSTNDTPVYTQSSTTESGEDDLGGEHGQSPPKK